MSGKEIEVRKPEVQIVNVADAREAMRAFEDFKKAVLTQDDFYESKGKRYVRKSGWMKYAMALGISTHVYNERSETVKFNGKEILAFHFEAKAVALNGRSAEAVGSASSDEGKPWSDAYHSIRAMAQTRAVERAISNLVGGGELGAEEADTKTFQAEYTVKESNPPLSHSMSDAEVSGEQDIIDHLIAIGLDPNGVEIATRDFGKFLISPIWPKPDKKENDPWPRYHECLKTLGAKYRSKDDPDPNLRGKWTVGF